MKYAKVLARVVLCAIVASIIMPIIMVTSSNDMSVDNAVIEDINPTEEVIEEITEPTEEPLIDTPILYSEVGYIVPVIYEDAVSHQNILKDYIAELKEAIASKKYTDNAIALMSNELVRLENDFDRYQLDIDRFTRWMEEYSVATTVWFYLRSQGFSEPVAAGIIGNMMIETSGGTLNLKPEIYGAGHYGLCQWSLYYRPTVKGMSLYEQLDYLMSDIKYELDTFGFCYKRNFNYEKFLQLTDAREAAIAFAKAYERPGAGTYTIRANSAEIAYNYFTNNN